MLLLSIGYCHEHNSSLVINTASYTGAGHCNSPSAVSTNEKQFCLHAPSLHQSNTVNTLLSVFSLINRLSVSAHKDRLVCELNVKKRLKSCFCYNLHRSNSVFLLYGFKSPPVRSLWRKGHWWCSAEVTLPE